EIGEAIAVYITHRDGIRIFARGERSQQSETAPAVAAQYIHLTGLFTVHDCEVEIAVAVEIRGGDGRGVGQGDRELHRRGKGPVAVAGQESHAAFGTIVRDG